MTRRAAEQGIELVGRLLAFARRQQLAARRTSTSAAVRRGDRAARPHALAAWSSSNGGRGPDLAALMPTAPSSSSR